MKKLLLTFTVLATTYMASAQVVFRGISPAPIVGNYNFEWSAPSAGGWATPNFLTPGVSVKDTLMLVEDGSLGTNAQGHPISQQGCNPLINDLTGKIAVVYRNVCEFSTKALNAQNAGAVAVIVINRDPAAIGMAPGTYGSQVTIPVVSLSSTDGAALVNQMKNGPVVVFIGNKQNLFANDGGASADQVLISRYGSLPLFMANDNYSFDLGLQMYNFGNITNSFTVTAEVTAPNGASIYNETVNATANSGDTLQFFQGSTTAPSFPSFQFSAQNPAIVGEYTLKYSIAVDGATDESDYDNEFVSTFNVTNDVLSLARQDVSTGRHLVNSFPSNATNSYQACMKFQEPFTSGNIPLYGLSFALSTTSPSITLDNVSIHADVFEWADTWTSLSNVSPYAQLFDTLNQIGQFDYVASEADRDKVVYEPFSAPILLESNRKYLVCLTTYEPEVSFGYDRDLAYDIQYGYYLSPISPLQIDGTWYSGWNGASAFSLGLKLSDCPDLKQYTKNIEECESYTTLLGNNITKSGAYYEVIPNSAGCDSAHITYNVNIMKKSITLNVSACETYTWSGNTYTTSGTYTYLGQTTIGCDSLVTLNLTINQPDASTFTESHCDSYTWNGVTYNQSGTYVFNTNTVNGCDSTATLNLTINYSDSSSENKTACNSYNWNGQTYTQSGTYVFNTNTVKGCDSTATLKLIILNGQSSTTSISECDSYYWNGNTYNSSGIYTIADTCGGNTSSYDTLLLTINNSVFDTISHTSCGSYSWNGNNYNSSGTYIFDGQTINGCDSTITLNLIINNPSTSSTTITTCNPYTWNGQTYNQSGSYTYTTQNAVGCDSVATLILTVNSAVATFNSANFTITASSGSSYQWVNCPSYTPISGANSQVYSATANGSYAVIITNNGCTDTSNCINVSNIGLNEIENLKFSAIPNPTFNEITLIIAEQFVGKTYCIRDFSGRIIMDGIINSKEQNIDLNSVSKGVYLLQVEGKTLKILKQ